MTNNIETKSSNQKFFWIGLVAVIVILGGIWFFGFNSAPAAEVASVPNGLEPAPIAGHPAPDFTLKTMDGHEVSLSDFKGQPVIINFWATWCGPCHLEMPHLQAAYTSSQDDGLVVLGVNLTERDNVRDVPGFLDEFGLTFPIVLDESGDVASTYRIFGQPASIFIDKDIDTPNFISPGEAEAWLADNEPVIALEIDGDARAYPLQIMTWHEIVNDTVGDVPVAVTFCPLCNSALTFDRRFDGQIFEFGTSGLLRNSDLVMYDRTTETLWQQFTGEGIVGDLAGEQLDFVPSSLISFADFRAAYPEGQILSRETGFSRRYGENPYVGYDTIGNNPFLFTGPVDGRLPAMERVVTVTFDNADIAYPLSVLSEVGVINDSQDGRDLAVFHTAGTSSALGAREIAQAEDVGATGVFDRNLDGQTLTFRREGDQIVDEETGSAWNILGQAIDGPLAGEQLSPVVHADHFWFSWAAFKPDTIIYTN